LHVDGNIADWLEELGQFPDGGIGQVAKNSSGPARPAPMITTSRGPDAVIERAR
jgi:hypothetical protein